MSLKYRYKGELLTLQEIAVRERVCAENLKRQIHYSYMSAEQAVSHIKERRA